MDFCYLDRHAKTTVEITTKKNAEWIRWRRFAIAFVHTYRHNNKWITARWAEVSPKTHTQYSNRECEKSRTSAHKNRTASVRLSILYIGWMPLGGLPISHILFRNFHVGSFPIVMTLLLFHRRWCHTDWANHWHFPKLPSSFAISFRALLFWAERSRSCRLAC